MTIKRTFRILVCLAMFLPIVGMVHTEIQWDNFPQKWQDSMALDGDGGLLASLDEENPEDIKWLLLLVAICGVLIASTIAGFIGFLLMKGWARTLMLILCVVGFILSFAWGFSVTPPLEETLFEISSVLIGVTLAMAFLPPLAQELGALAKPKSPMEV